MPSQVPLTSEALPVQLAGKSLVLRELHTSSDNDMQALLALHRAVFGSSADADWFSWKYRDGHAVGFGLWQGLEMVAHCGGIPRNFWHERGNQAWLQIGDVMVAPAWRGFLTRSSPFWRVSEGTYRNFLGTDKPFRIGFGFPNLRHMDLAEKTRLAWHACDIHQLTWSCDGPLPSLGWAWQSEIQTALFPSTVELAWEKMQLDFSARGIALGERSWKHLVWRYLKRPDKHYLYAVLRRPWRRQAAGVVVLSAQAPWQWLDWIGPADLMPMACIAARKIAQNAGTKELSAWCSPLVEKFLSSTPANHRTTVAALGVPRHSDLQGQTAQGYPWWFMGGDTDFL